jgi:GDP/UDP-N,N'-diacetylbacillosamine 2-epimerase (hydrolysing)
VAIKVCVLTGSRAEYGLLRWIIEGIAQHPTLQLQLVVTGMHLAPEFGLTYREIESDGFHIDRKVEMLLSSDTPTGITKSIALGLTGLADALDLLKPDLLLVLGDRFEVLAAATAATVARIPIAHLHGGEVTEGAIDDAFRHAITKMAHFHFVAAEEYQRRVIQLGEHPTRVFLVGGLGADSIRRLPLLSREELERQLEFRFGPRNLLVTFHPATSEPATAEHQMDELLAALAELDNTHLVFTMPNADTDGRILFKMIQRFVAHRPTAKSFISLGNLRYLSCLSHVDAVVGNSSSGLTEAPSLRKPTINIGDRQRGRAKAESVLDCAPDRNAIRTAIEQAYSPAFRRMLEEVRSPYGDGGASERVVEILPRLPLHNVLKKSFYDIDHGARPRPPLSPAHGRTV